MIAWLALAAFAATDPEAALSRGMAAQRAGDVDAAKTAYRECLAAAPEHIGCRWELGWSAWSERDWEEVVVQWEAVQRADPAHPELDKWLTIAQGHVASLTQLRALATTAPATARAPLPEGTTVRLRAVGDIMLGTDFPHPTDYLPPQDGAHLLDAVAPALQDADFTFGNLEGPLCDGGETTKCGEGENCYAFRTPTRYGAYLVDAGFDLMSTANNHSGDFGESCRRETEATLDSLGIAWSGPPGSIATIDVDDVAVALVAFHTSPACNDVNDRETAKLLVAAAAARADLVVVSFHGGAEGSKALHVPQGQETFYGENRGSLRAFARDVVGAGADLVIGHGPHVPRGMELVDGRLVAYSLGNFATYGRFSLGGHLSTSLILEATLAADGTFVQGQILPVRLQGAGIPTPDPENTAVDLIRSLTGEDFPSAGLVIAQDGTVAPG